MEEQPLSVTHAPGSLGTAGVHPDVKFDAYNFKPDGTAVPFVTQEVKLLTKVLHKSAYAAELECTEKDTRHWIHRLWHARTPAPAGPTALQRPRLRPPREGGRTPAAPPPQNRASGAASSRPLTQCTLQVVHRQEQWAAGPYSAHPRRDRAAAQRAELHFSGGEQARC